MDLADLEAAAAVVVVHPGKVQVAEVEAVQRRQEEAAEEDVVVHL